MKITQASLGDHRLWKPVYGRYSSGVMTQRLNAVEAAGIDTKKMAATRAFTTRAYDQYFHRVVSPHYGFVFAIPTRINRQTNEYISEARHFLPIVDELEPVLVQIIMSELPPVVLDEYHDVHGRVVGAVMFIPIFSDMVHDVRPRLRAKRGVQKIIKDAALFAKNTLHAEIMGLGATLPKLTNFGKTIQRFGLTTTTGHAGTVYLIYKEFTAIIEGDQHVVVGVIGAGSISSSASAMILATYPYARIIIYDIRKSVLANVVHDLRQTYGHGRVVAAESNDHVMQGANVIISAVTSHISVGGGVDLRGKVIIDDSQPGSFARADVEGHGGKLVWVVGHDETASHILTRRSTFRYGDEGLCDSGDVWGCEAEVASLWLSGMTHLAVNETVSPTTVMAIGKVMDDVGITRADWQAAGTKVSLPQEHI